MQEIQIKESEHNKKILYINYEVNDRQQQNFLPVLAQKQYLIGFKRRTLQHYYLANTQQEVKMQKYLQTLLYIKNRYENIQIQLDKFERLIEILLQKNQILLAFKVKIIQNPRFYQAEKLAQKLKVMILKGKRTTNYSMTEKYQSCIQRCKIFQSEKMKAIDKMFQQKKMLSEEIRILKNKFHIINQKTLKFYCTHTLKKKYEKQPIFYINFFTQKLLFVQKQVIDFQSNLLYCPIIFQEKLKISEQYEEQLNKYNKNWSKLILTIQIIKITEQKQQILYTSYLKKNYPDNRLNYKITAIRDKIYQFMIMEYLKKIFKTKKRAIEIILWNNIKIKIHLRTKNEQSKYTIQFVSYYYEKYSGITLNIKKLKNIILYSFRIGNQISIFFLIDINEQISILKELFTCCYISIKTKFYTILVKDKQLKNITSQIIYHIMNQLLQHFYFKIS